MILMGGKERSIGEKTCPSATLSITDPTRPDLKTNPGLRGKIPATNPSEPWRGFEKEN